MEGNTRFERREAMASNHQYLPFYEDDTLPQYQSQDDEKSNDTDLEVPSALAFFRERDVDSNTDGKSSLDLNIDPEEASKPASNTRTSSSRRRHHHRTVTVKIDSFSLYTLCLMAFVALLYLTMSMPASGSGYAARAGVGRGGHGKDCTRLGRVSGFPAPERVEWSGSSVSTADADVEGGVAEILSRLKSSIHARWSEHQSLMGSELHSVTSSLVTITSALDAESQEMAQIRSLMSKNDVGEDACGVQCAAAVATYFRSQYLAAEKGGCEEVRKLLLHLELMDKEMVAYSEFLQNVEGKMAVLNSELGGASPSILEATSSRPIPIHDANSISYKGNFSSTEFLVRNHLQELGAALIQAYSTTPSPYDSAALAFMLEKSIKNLPFAAYGDEKIYVCTYEVKISQPDMRRPAGVELKSLVCDIEI